jgi:lipopolysaccharide export system permease protein
VRILNRYLAREIFFGTALVLAGLVFLFGVFDLIHELNDLGRGRYQLTQMFVFVLLAAPGHAYELFPIAVLMGTIFGLGQLAAGSEITVMLTAGMSRARLALAALRAGLVLVVLAFALGEGLMPFTEQFAQKWRLAAMDNFVTSQFRSGFWVKDHGDFVNVHELLPDNSLKGVRIYEFGTDHRLLSVSYAQKAVYDRNNQWNLLDVERTHFDSHGVSIEHQSKELWDSTITPSMLSTLVMEPEQMSAWNLFSYIRHLRDNSQKTVRFEIAQWSKLLYPFSLLVMIMLALPFAIRKPRAGGVGMRVMAGIGLGLTFYLVNRLFAYLGQLNDWNPIVSTLFPALLFLTISWGMIRWQER